MAVVYASQLLHSLINRCAEGRVVGHDEQHVGRALRRDHARWKPRCRLRGLFLDHPAEFRIRRWKLFAVERGGGTGVTNRASNLNLCPDLRRRGGRDGQKSTDKQMLQCFIRILLLFVRSSNVALAGYFRVRFFDCDLAFTADQTNSCSFSRTTSTGQGAARTTRSAVLPMQKCFHPVYPCVAITIRSTSKSLAASTIRCDAIPVRSVDRVSLRPPTWAELSNTRRFFSALASFFSKDACAPGSSIKLRDETGSSTCSKMRCEPNSFAKRYAYLKAFREGGEKSCGTRIFFNAKVGCSGRSRRLRGVSNFIARKCCAFLRLAHPSLAKSVRFLAEHDRQTNRISRARDHPGRARGFKILTTETSVISHFRMRAAEHSFHHRVICRSLDRFRHIRNHFRRKRSAQGIEHCQHVDNFLADRSGYRSQISAGREHHAAQAQHHSADRAL